MQFSSITCSILYWSMTPSSWWVIGYQAAFRSIYLFSWQSPKHIFHYNIILRSRLTGTHGSQYHHRNWNSTETYSILCNPIMPTFNYHPLGMSMGHHLHLYLYPNTKKRTSRRTILSQLSSSLFEQPQGQYTIDWSSNNISTLLIPSMWDQL